MSITVSAGDYGNVFAIDRNGFCATINKAEAESLCRDLAHHLGWDKPWPEAAPVVPVGPDWPRIEIIIEDKVRDKYLQARLEILDGDKVGINFRPNTRQELPCADIVAAALRDDS